MAIFRQPTCDNDDVGHNDRFFDDKEIKDSFFNEDTILEKFLRQDKGYSVQNLK